MSVLNRKTDFSGILREAGYPLRAAACSQCADGIADYSSAMIKDFLEFDDRFGALPRSHVCLAPHVNRIEGAEEPIYGATRLAQLIGYGGL